MKLSIVPEIINSEEIKIFDKNSIQINICKKSEFKFNYGEFVNPSIIIDNFEKRKYKDIEIKRISLETLESFGYRLVSIKATSKTRNFPRQMKSYLLEKIDNPIPFSEVMAKIPDSHFIELDVINSRIRIKGKYSFPYNRNENATPWIPVYIE